MKQIIIAGFLSLGALTSSIFTQAAAAQTQIESIQDMAGWMQSITTIQIDITSLFAADAMAEIFNTLDSGNDESIRLLGQQFEAERQVVLARARRQINELSPPERWDIDRSLFSRQEKAIFVAAKNQYNSLNETYALFETLTDSLSEILNNPDDLDEEGLLEVYMVQHKAGIRLIELENEQIDGYLVAIPESNPNHQFQKIVKQFNLATIPELKISLLDNQLTERHAYAEAFGEELDKIRPLLRRGQRNAQSQIKQLEGLNPATLSSADKTMRPIVLKIYENFEEAIKVETQMLEAMERSYDLYTSEKSDEEIEPFIDENDLEFFHLSEKRAEYVQYRLSLLQ